MVTEKFRMDIVAVGTDNGSDTYEIRRKWGDKGKKSLIIELYPTLTVDKCQNMDISTLHLLNHAGEMGWSEVRIVNLYSTVFSAKPSASQLTDNDTNLSYIEMILEEEGIKDYDIVIAWGNTLLTHTKTIHAKTDLLYMMKEKGLINQVKCIVTEHMESYGVHPLYLGLRHSNERWKLKKYPVEKVLSELEANTKKPEKNAEPKKSSKGNAKNTGKEKKGADKDVPQNHE